MKIFETSNQTLEVTLLLLPDSSMMSLASVLDVMRAANRLARRKLFNWKLVTLDGEPATLTCGLPIHPQGQLDNNSHGNILIIISGFDQQKHVDDASLKRIKAIMRSFDAVGGVEAGSWVLARTGKLNGKKATTHWEDLEEFATQFPKVTVRPDRFVIDGDLFTTSGASPSFDFMLHLIRLRYGYHLALEVSSAFIYDGVHTGSDAQPLLSLGNLEQQEPRVAAAIRLMEQHLEDTLSLQMIAQQLGLSVRMLAYLFEQNLKLSPGKFYLRLRLQASRRLVLDTRIPMQEIALRTGFNSLSAFSRQFKGYYKVNASECRKSGI